mmetsp:Transcript_12543/g.36659  ORF Transcript_12543/g.36659 Transcript_12543/m.36659 type:complete len:275 (+) Transcript_12543:350-1174(+)
MALPGPAQPTAPAVDAVCCVRRQKSRMRSGLANACTSSQPRTHAPCCQRYCCRPLGLLPPPTWPTAASMGWGCRLHGLLPVARHLKAGGRVEHVEAGQPRAGSAREEQRSQQPFQPPHLRLAQLPALRVGAKARQSAARRAVARERATPVPHTERAVACARAARHIHKHVRHLRCVCRLCRRQQQLQLAIQAGVRRRAHERDRGAAAAVAAVQSARQRAHDVVGCRGRAGRAANALHSQATLLESSSHRCSAGLPQRVWRHQRRLGRAEHCTEL